MSFSKYCFSVNDVIKGLNEYYGHGVNAEWPFLMIENGVVDAVRRDKVYFSKLVLPEVLRRETGKTSFLIVCDPAEAAIDAVKWLGSIGVVYYPWMNAISEPEPCEPSLRKLMAERNKFGKRLSDIRKAAGMADGDPTDLVEYISKLRSQRDKYRQNSDKYETLIHCIRSIIEDIKKDTE